MKLRSGQWRHPYILLAAILMPLPAIAQDLAIPEAVFPKLADFALDSDVFAPQGWAIEAQAVGDLDGDGDEDVVFTLREQNPANILKNDGLGQPELNTNPRILGAGFREGHGYRLALQNNTLIPRNDNPTMEDPFEPDGGLAVARGAFSVNLNQFANAGSWETANVKLTFRWQNGGFEMIGWDRTTVLRNSGEMTEVSANLSTGKLVIAQGSIEHDRKEVTTRKIDTAPMPIDDVGDGLAFNTGVEGAPGL